MSHDANTEIMERFWEEVHELNPDKIDRKMVDAWIEQYVPLGLSSYGIMVLRGMSVAAPIKRVAEEARAQEAETGIRSAMLESSTCDVCLSKDGARFTIEELDEYATPDPDCFGGDQCNCIVIFIKP